MSARSNTCRWAVISLLLVITCNRAFAAKTLYVDDDGPADFNNIQSAIDDANDGDSIIVQPGLYKEFVKFHGKNITLTSTNPGDFNVVAATIIDYGAGFVGTEEPNCTLTGFKINGWISGVDYIIDPTGENHTHATISYCLLQGNMVSRGTVIRACDGTIINCVVVDNCPNSDWIGPAISECHGLIKNCIVAHNFETGIWVSQGCTTTIENCIIYYNPMGIWVDGTVNILYTDVDGGIFGGGNVNWGTGNIDADPCFVRVGDWFGELKGDYHLKSQAGRWDANERRWTKDEVTSPCIDAGDMASPIGFELFPNGGIINMGAYGGTAEASKSYFGQPVCETIIAGDINGDCRVDFADFAIMATHWLEDNTPTSAITTTYVFRPDPNALRTSGGFAGQGQGSRSIEGRFELTIDFDAGIAWFNNVDATLSEEVWIVGRNGEGLIFTDSLDVIFNMTELVSTDVSETTIDFLLDRGDCPGCFPPYTDIHLRATFIENSVHLVGDFCDPCCDFYCYLLDAVAVPSSAQTLLRTSN